MEQQYRIYMDVCCLNRPFDDWTQPRIRLEAEAVLEIAAGCQAKTWQLVSSTALESEIAKTPDLLRRQRVMASLKIAETRIIVTVAMLERAKELVALGFKSFDALHLSCAESANVDIFLTTDDRLLRKASVNQTSLNVTVANSMQWFMEISQVEGENK
ncbi:MULTISPECIES: PIN domain-containing protein [unclassified Coleofasciculus]|uniref:PIN domain-containing protein n=1 Tax=unclassified Coleofasciculus TaxID=2692782 RepID=UPI00187E6FBE|nr:MULTISPECIES: PIN domain-containing protein [unclassified Coleofasciculus]MBE9125019.1 PIN domain-containing protein [Coleofasciculus sp. LEGE 07081]MBE9147661.1 PIN domain-containing protein [Coleofasciculus sp. LEGE 07092]